jgi:hypothetical protein
LLIVNSNVFFELCSRLDGLEEIKSWCHNANKIWVCNDIDGLLFSVINYKNILQADTIVPKNAIQIFVDGKLSVHHALNSIKNINLKTIPYNFFLSSTRIPYAKVQKNNCKKDFLMTTCKKVDRPHRTILWNELVSRPGLLDRGIVNYHVRGSLDQWIGNISHQHTFHEGHPSMDLYHSTWLELVPETMYKDGYFITEKTVKPIVTGTPFLIVSSCGYLDYLRSMGFRTFEKLIDEKYDKHHRIQDRVTHLVNVLEHIVSTGAEDFYHQSQDILLHNRSRFFEISGRRQYDLDQFFCQELENIGIIAGY